ncbi:MAG: hypothetical protein CMJ83_14545 [Planctomycetes bacterium]|nr:hypothetical protein [Planctomycetota bacterium]
MSADPGHDLGRFHLAYWGFFAYLGATGPFLTVFFKEDLHLGPEDSGALMALLTSTTIVGGLLAARMADAWRARHLLRRVMSLAAALLCLAWFVVGPDDFALAAVVIALQGLCIGPQIPFLDAATVDALGRDDRRYGSIRIWGTISWGCTAIIVGAARQWLSVARLIPMIMVAALALFHYSSWRIPDAQAASATTRPRLDLRAARRSAPLMALLAACFLHGVTFGNYEYFSALTFEELGATKLEVSMILVVGIVCEALVFAFSSKLLARFGPRRLCLAATLVTGVRWLLMPIVSTIPELVALQTTHAFTFALWYAPALHLTSRLVEPEVRTSGQSLLFLSLAAGSATGAFVGGNMRGEFGMTPAFLGAAVINGLAALVLLAAWRTFDDATPVGARR